MVRYLLLLLLNFVCVNSYKDYTGELVLSVHPQTEEQLITLQDIFQNFSAHLDLWVGSTNLEKPWLIRVKITCDVNSLTSSFIRANIRYFVKHRNLNALLDKYRHPRRQRDASFLDRYHRYEDITSYIKKLTATNKNMTISAIGSTIENRDIFMVKFSSGKKSRPMVFIECGAHAREWISTAVCLYFITWLSDTFNQSSSINQSSMSNYDWSIVPLMNPDGYAYSHTVDRIWRKNRRVIQNASGSCHGVDLNRNFDADFGGTGSGRIFCGEDYPGTEPFSEPESRSVRDFVLKEKNRIEMYLSLHSYQQVWLYPFGFMKNSTPNEEHLKEVSKAAVEAIERAHGARYTLGSIFQQMYRVSGDSIDWAYLKAGVNFSFGIELRDTGTHGFLLPEQLIKPTAEEMWAGVTAALEKVKMLRMKKLAVNVT